MGHADTAQAVPSRLTAGAAVDQEIYSGAEAGCLAEQEDGRPTSSSTAAIRPNGVSASNW
jgi:hypothetical protein